MDDTQDKSTEIVEGEVVEETDSTQPAAESNDATILLSLEELIKNNIESIEALRLESRKEKEMFDDVFVNDEMFQKHSENVKEVNKAKSTRRQEILKQPSVAAMAGKAKNTKSEIKERMGALSDYLQEYQRLTGATQIESRDGKLLDIVNSAKLINQSSKPR